MNVYTYKEKELPWVETARKNPDFDITCLIYNERFGKYMAYYHPVGELGGVIYGEWRDDRDKTTLPPAYWIYLHDIPAPITRSDDVKTDKNRL